VPRVTCVSSALVLQADGISQRDHRIMSEDYFTCDRAADRDGLLRRAAHRVPRNQWRTADGVKRALNDDDFKTRRESRP